MKPTVSRTVIVKLKGKVLTPWKRQRLHRLHLHSRLSGKGMKRVNLFLRDTSMPDYVTLTVEEMRWLGLKDGEEVELTIQVSFDNANGV